MIRNIILDLDQTIIDSYMFGTADYNVFGKYKYTKILDNSYITFHRPHMNEFLDFLFKHFKVSIWTAASKEYCFAVVDSIILKNNPERRIKHIMHSEHCDESMGLYNNHPKNISIMWEIYNLKNFTKENTVLIDDNYTVINGQSVGSKTIMVKQFKVSNKSDDDYLLKIMDTLKDYNNIK